jgi:hypothetical protein
MAFNFGIRRPIATSRVSSGSGGREGETWVDDYWQSGVTEEYQNLKNILDLNPGQQAILESEEESILSYLFDISEDYSPDEFLSFLQGYLTDGKYEALSITWEEYSVTLEDIWDHSSGGDGYSVKKFLGTVFS